MRIGKEAMTKLSNDLALSEFRGMVVVPGGPLHVPGILRPRDGAALAPSVAGRVPRRGDPESRRLTWSTRSGTSRSLSCASKSDTITAFFNACAHRGTRLASGTGNFATSEIRCRYHAWRWHLDGEIIEVVDRHNYPAALTDDDVRLGEVQVGRWGGFVFVNMDPYCEPFDGFLGDIPELFASYRMEELRFRSYRTIVFDCNWKTAIDSFNEAYHPQGLHPQMLTWFDDTRFSYAPVGQHSLYGEEEYRA